MVALCVNMAYIATMTATFALQTLGVVVLFGTATGIRGFLRDRRQQLTSPAVTGIALPVCQPNPTAKQSGHPGPSEDSR